MVWVLRFLVPIARVPLQTHTTMLGAPRKRRAPRGRESRCLSNLLQDDALSQVLTPSGLSRRNSALAPAALSPTTTLTLAAAAAASALAAAAPARAAAALAPPTLAAAAIALSTAAALAAFTALS